MLGVIKENILNKKTTNRVIAFIDIMGFKNLVQTKSHSQILKKMESLSVFVNDLDKKEWEAFGAKSRLRTIIFSDSIVLISENDTVSSAINVIYHTADLVMYCFEIGLPIKGCISYGKFTADFEKSLFFGQPLIDAYILQEELQVYSVLIHHSFEAKFGNKKYSNTTLKEGGRILNLKTPMKGCTTTHYHLNWLFYYLYDFKKNDWYYDVKKNEEIMKILEKFYSTVSGRPRIYVDNTIELAKKFIETTTPNNG